MDDGQTTGVSGRVLRADAIRNRERILRAAAEVFAAKGVSVPIDLVAERAGVGVGTLYRHFPTKEALFAAIVGGQVGELASAARAAQRGPDPGRALFEFIGLLANQAASRHDLLDALEQAGVEVESAVATQMVGLAAGIAGLLERAMAQGAVRTDVGAEDVLGLVVGTCHGIRRMGGDAATACRLVAIVCEGLRTAPG
jgi:AcrR family transcriptional regulator